MEENKEIASRQETAIGKTIGRRGHEDAVAKEDLIVPRAKLLQALSPEVQENPDVFRQGLIINSITKEELPRNAEGWIVFVPVIRSVNWIRFNPRNDNDPDYNPDFEMGAIIWRCSDPKDPRVVDEGSWGKNSEPPKATKFINYLAHVPGTDMPIVMSFAKTSFRAGKQLTTMSQFAEGDLFSWKYRVRAKKEQNDAKQQYYVLEVAKAGRNEGDDFRAAEKMYENFKGLELKVHEEESQEPTESKEPWE